MTVEKKFLMKLFICFFLLFLSGLQSVLSFDTEEDYIIHCSGCHMEDGTGSSRNAVPSIRNISTFTRVPSGREYIIQVADVSQSSLNDKRLSELVNWVLLNLGSNTPPKDFLPYSEIEIAQLRTNRPGDITKKRQEVMHELQETRPKLKR